MSFCEQERLSQTCTLEYIMRLDDFATLELTQSFASIPNCNCIIIPLIVLEVDDELYKCFRLYLMHAIRHVRTKKKSGLRKIFHSLHVFGQLCVCSAV